MKYSHPFEQFLSTFIPKVASKSRQHNKALWLLETTGNPDAADLNADLNIELRSLFSDFDTYEKLNQWNKDSSLEDPLLKRQLKVLIREFQENIIPKTLLEEITRKETDLLLTYANFRPQLDGKPLSENEIREVLKNSLDSKTRKKVWEASKNIGDLLAEDILSLVVLRNQTAKQLGYSDYFEMQLNLQEVDESWLFHFLDEISLRSETAYIELIQAIEKEQCQRFSVPYEELGPWAWGDPFSQEDPIDSSELDSLVSGIDICDKSIDFYRHLGFDLLPVLQKSDMEERTGKNQHAFCINIDRETDVRTLNNVKSSLRWLETVLHEFGHAVYELCFDAKLPWLLRKPPHMMTTEAMALIAGRQAYLPESLPYLIVHPKRDQLKKAEESLMRRQLIFSRWALVMTFFEKELYRNPTQDLNRLWWEIVGQYQKIRVPKNRKGKNDWASKYHIAFAPVYYYSYLLGEVFASSIEETLMRETGRRSLTSEHAGKILKQKLFSPGNCMSWNDLVQHVIGKPFTSDDWIRQFASCFGS